MPATTDCTIEDEPLVPTAESLALIGAAILGLSNVLAAPVASHYGSHRVAAALAVALGLFFWLASPLVWGRPEAIMQPTRAVLYAVLGAAPLLAAGSLLFWESVRRLGMPVAFPIASSYPLLTSLFGFVFLNEAFSLLKILGTISIIGGISLLSISNPVAGTDVRKRGSQGLLLAFLAMLCWAGNTVLVKLAVDAGLGIYAVNLVRMPVMAVLLCAALALHKRRRIVQPLALRPMVILALAAALSGVQDLIYFYTLRASSLSIIVPLASTAPLFALPLAVLVLKERVTLRTGAGTVLVVAGIGVLS